MSKTRSSPLTAPRGGHEHDFLQPRESWDVSCFDRAALFAVVELRRDRRRTEFRVLPWAIRYANQHLDDGACLYAIAESGRFALLDRARWNEWEDRWMIGRGILTPTGRTPSELPPLQNPYRGTIACWERVSAPQGLGYAVSGLIGGRKVLTTSILRAEGDEVETLSWRYTLGEERR